jgi:hypothetical protein
VEAEGVRAHIIARAGQVCSRTGHRQMMSVRSTCIPDL